MRLVETERFPCGVRTVTEALPYLALFVFFAAEENAARFLARDDDQYRFGFAKPREIVEIAVVTIGIVRVAIARSFGRSRHDCDTALHARRQAFAACDVRGRVHRVAFPVRCAARDRAISAAQVYPRRTTGRCSARR